MIKLYETNSYLKECETVISSAFEKDGNYYITLEETIFFPEEGGQYADTGVIIVSDNGVMHNIQLFDGQIVDGEIVYKIASMVEAGTKVKCVLDYEKRYDRMQNHSGEHLLTGVIHNKYGYVNKGFHLSDDSFVTLDISGPMTYEEVLQMEREANRLIYKNLPITDSYPTDDELKNINYRSKIEIEGQVRLITIGDENDTIDICACCAPHVARTGEIGLIKVTGVVNWKGGVRVSILAGRRAFEYISGEHELIKTLTGMLTTSAENIVGITEAHMKEIAELKSKLNNAMEKSVISEIEAYRTENADAQNIYRFVDGEYSQATLKNIYNYMTEHFEGYVGIFAGDDESGYRYLAGSSHLDSRLLAGMLKEKLGVKGGGNERMVQGQAKASKEQLEMLLADFAE